MIVSWNWLAQYVLLDMPVQELTDRLMLAGLNHEATEEVGGDFAIDLEVTSNRPDCLGQLGVAREAAVLFGKDLRIPDPRPRESGAPVGSLAAVEIEAPDLCPRFTARVVSGARIGESPWWLRKRLETIGVRPISNVVDVTNYVMFECGQPLHAYDLARLAGRRIVVRRARAGEELTAINNKKYELAAEMLVIADADRPVGLAGVMGGLDTEIGPETADILIEAARFDAMSVRRTARALGLHSAASHRFERPMDPEGTDWASRRCAELILEVAGGTLHPGVVDVGPRPGPRPTVTLRLGQIKRVLGIEVDRERVVAILQALGLESVGDLTFRPPSWRSDLGREIDLIEEVARIHGYEQIPMDRPVPLAKSSRSPRERVEAAVREALTGLGFDEAVTYSLVAESWIAPLQPTPPRPPIRVEHSTRKLETALRQSLTPSLLAARAHNEAHGTPDADLFEIAHVYLPRADAPRPDEPPRLAILAGRDFPGMKGVVEALLGRLHAGAGLEARPSDQSLFAPGRQAELMLGGKHLGYVGEIGRAQLDAFELRAVCAAAELDLDVLIAHADLVPAYRPLPKSPAVTRDLSLVLGDKFSWSELADAARHAGGPILEAAQYLDTFRGGSVPAGSQSLHFGLRFRHPERTLTGEEVERAVGAIVEECKARFGATLRT